MEDKVVKNETQATPNEKPTYEDLNNWCYQLAEQNRKLKAQVQSMNLTNAFKRQDYLFEIINIPRYICKMHFHRIIRAHKRCKCHFFNSYKKHVSPNNTLRFFIRICRSFNIFTNCF